jgi:hypothetical protein
MIRNERPPNYDAIVAALPTAAKLGIVFAYGEDIYNPSGNNLPRCIIEHEIKHGARQFVYGVEAWWKLYVESSEFRYEEELWGHVAELQSRLRGQRDRNARYKILSETAVRLIAPIYAYAEPRTYKQAMADLTANI